MDGEEQAGQWEQSLIRSQLRQLWGGSCLVEGDLKQLWLTAMVPVHYLGQGPRQPCPVSRGVWEDLTGPSVAICKANLLDSVASQGIDASSPVFVDENSESGAWTSSAWSVLILSGLVSNSTSRVVLSLGQ